MEHEEEWKKGNYCLPLKITMICGNQTVEQEFEGVNYNQQMQFQSRIFSNYECYHLKAFSDKNGKRLTYIFWAKSEFSGALLELQEFCSNIGA